ncbi:protein-S-isoprenylcysteine O-methyltransferase [Winogradskyella sp.]|uniref:protein-S-isoprenylcysteine O-methyltransferase n=1 Tax=Winogradskyella sp. TaxID=1883156 RepID=UPI0026316555|nr:protein-S-isoprenylcysteine O-methyltransferase [Winogradskyella sp.]
MEPIFLKIGYGIILLGTSIIRYPHGRRNKANQIITNRKENLEKLLLGLTFLGMMIIPLIYMFTHLFAFANYNLPVSLQIIGILLIAPMLWLFYRSHKDLGQNWSVSLEIRQDHHIVDSGVYKYIRHPMYSAIWLWVIIQALLLNNYIAGLAGLISFGSLYFLRVKNEEQMMISEFGTEYVKYMQKTKRIIPFVI